MKRLGFVFALWVLLCGQVGAQLAGGLIFPGPGTPASTGNQITLDGSAAGTTGSSSTATVTLTTTKTNDFVVLCVQVNSTGVSTVADVAGLTWTQIGVQTGTLFCYRAFSTGVLSSDVITITFTSLGAFSSTVAFALNGTSGASALDVNGALPGTTTTSTPLTLTTSNANDLLFAAYSLNTGSGTAGSGWTLVPGSGGNFMMVEYQLVTATQSALSAAIGTGTIKNGIGHAVRSQ